MRTRSSTAGSPSRRQSRSGRSVGAGQVGTIKNYVAQTSPPYTHTHAHTHARTHAHMHARTHMHTHTHTHTHTLCVCAGQRRRRQETGGSIAERRNVWTRNYKSCAVLQKSESHGATSYVMMMSYPANAVRLKVRASR